MGGCGSKPDEVYLADEEIMAIRDAWTRTKSLPIGRQILLAIIAKKPKVGTLFGFPRGTSSVTILENQRFLKESERIHNFLDTIICSLGFCSMSEVHEMSRQIGKNHYYKGIELDDEVLSVFRAVTVEEILRTAEENREQEAKAAESSNALKPIEAGILGGTMLLKVLLGKGFQFQDVTNPFATLNCLARIGWDKLASEICRNIRKGYNDEKANCQSSAIGQSKI